MILSSHVPRGKTLVCVTDEFKELLLDTGHVAPRNFTMGFYAKSILHDRHVGDQTKEVRDAGM